MKVIKYAQAIKSATKGFFSGLVSSVSAHLKQIKEIEETAKRDTENFKRAADALQKMAFAAQKTGGSIEK